MRGASLWVSTSDLGQLISYEEIFVRKNYDLRLVPFMPKLIIDCGAQTLSAAYADNGNSQVAKTKDLSGLIGI